MYVNLTGYRLTSSRVTCYQRLVKTYSQPSSLALNIECKGSGTITSVKATEWRCQGYANNRTSWLVCRWFTLRDNRGEKESSTVHDHYDTCRKILTSWLSSFPINFGRLKSKRKRWRGRKGSPSWAKSVATSATYTYIRETKSQYLHNGWYVFMSRFRRKSSSWLHFLEIWQGPYLQSPTRFILVQDSEG